MGKYILAFVLVVGLVLFFAGCTEVKNQSTTGQGSNLEAEKDAKLHEPLPEEETEPETE